MNVSTNSRANIDGTIVSFFTSREGTVATNYVYPTPQDNLEIFNKGSVNLILNVGTFTNQTIQPNKRWKNDISFSNFDIKAASGTCEYDAIALNYAVTTSTILKGTTALRPTNAVLGQFYLDVTLGKPIWKKNATQWIDATGTVV